MNSLRSLRDTLLENWSTVVAFGIPFAVYVATLAPTVYYLDSAELTTAAATLGLMRSTGYPLYILLGRIWAWFPVGDIGYRLNLFSAFNGALTIALAERILKRLGVNPWARLGALGLLAFSPFFWVLSLTAEVYTLHTALMAGLLILLLRWDDEPTSMRMAAVFFLLGLSFGNHISTLLLLPGIGAYLLSGRKRALTWRGISVSLIGFLIGISVYLYLPIRYATFPAFNYAGQFDALGNFHPVNLQSWQGFLWLVSGQRFSHLMFSYQDTSIFGEVFQFGENLWNTFLIIGVGPGLLGLIILLRRNWRFAVSTLLLFLGHAVFYINYAVPDKELMFLPNYLLWALWIGVGYDWLFSFLVAAFPNGRDRRTVRWQRNLIGGLLLLPAFVALVWHWSDVSLAGDWSARERGEFILEHAEPNALIIGHWDTVPLLEYLQLVEGQRPDVKIVSWFLISEDDLEQLILSELKGRPVYIDFPPEEAYPGFYGEPFGPLYQLVPEVK